MFSPLCFGISPLAALVEGSRLPPVQRDHLMSLSDREIDWALVQRVQNGDMRAFEALVNKYQRKVGRLLSRMVRDPDDIEDIVQDSFIKAYKALNNFRGESAFYTWLYRIAINTAKNFLVASNRRPIALREGNDEESETFDDSDTLSDMATPESVYSSRQIAATVNKAVEDLPEELKNAIVLREIEGLSYEEIAEVMGCPIGTVRSRIFRAREAISERLKPLLDRSGDKRW
jgi:RNA polymerase sigma-70 factor (ECF subfamily)